MLAAQKFDIFYDDPLEPLLIASFEEFGAAQAAMADFALHVPGQYFLWSPGADEVLEQLHTGGSLLRSWLGVS